MPTVRLTWGDPNNNEDGVYVYRDTSPLDTANPENLPTPIAELAADVTSYDDDTAASDTTYYYAVAHYKGDFVNPADEVEVSTAPDPYASAQIGDEIGGGIYAGQITYGDGREFHIVFAKQEGEITSLEWKLESTDTPDTFDEYDGASNTAAMEDAGISNHPAANHCRSYTSGGHADWYLPARNEIKLVDGLYALGHPEFQHDASGYRWCSTAKDDYAVWLYSWSGSEANGGRTGARPVRPIRRVPV